MKSSLTYQLLLYLGGYYFACYELLELLLLLYKAFLLPYPTGVLFSEVLFVLLLAVVEAARLLSGWKGNLTESAGDCNIPELPILAHTRASRVNGLSQIPYLYLTIASLSCHLSAFIFLCNGNGPYYY